MYQVIIKTPDGKEVHEYHSSWLDVIIDGYLMGLWFLLLGITNLIATPFFAAKAAYRQWKSGGKSYVPTTEMKTMGEDNVKAVYVNRQWTGSDNMET